MGYDFTKVGVTGLKVLGQYTKINQDKQTAGALATVLNSVSADTESTYWSGQIAYDIPSLKGLTLSLEYEDAKKEDTATVNSNELRFRTELQILMCLRFNLSKTVAVMPLFLLSFFHIRHSF